MGKKLGKRKRSSFIHLSKDECPPPARKKLKTEISIEHEESIRKQITFEFIKKLYNKYHPLTYEELSNL